MLLDKLYIVPNYQCNLNCPHCDLHNKKIRFKPVEFFKSLNSINAREYILFGGEPLLYNNRFISCLKTNKITGISTNLLLLNQEKLDLLKKYDIEISTSWNPQRFTDKQYKIWLKNLTLLAKNRLQATVLVTLTEDLLLLEKSRLFSVFNDMEQTQGVNGILFEYLLSPDTYPDFNTYCDQFLCQLQYEWKWGFNNFILDRLKNWNCNCSNIRTLLPDGTIQLGCPQFELNLIKTKEKCLECNLAGICNPCRLQKYCAFPKKLYQEIIYGCKN